MNSDPANFLWGKASAGPNIGTQPFSNNHNHTLWLHDYVKLKKFPALLAICARNSPVPGEFPAKRQWRGGLLFSLIYTRINGWVNNDEAGNLRRLRAHYDVTVMSLLPETDKQHHNALFPLAMVA